MAEGFFSVILLDEFSFRLSYTPLKISGWNIIMEVWFISGSFLNGWFVGEPCYSSRVYHLCLSPRIMVQWKITLNERVQPTNGDIPFSTYSHDYGKRWVFNYGQGSSTPINNPLFLMVINPIPSLKLTFSPLKMDGWNTILSYWGPGLFSEARVVGLKIPFFLLGILWPQKFETCWTPGASPEVRPERGEDVDHQWHGGWTGDGRCLPRGAPWPVKGGTWRIHHPH